MPKNFKNKLTGQIGESLVISELGRKGIVATSFAGNVPDIDILAYRDGKSLPIQVKAFTGVSIHFDAKTFLEIEMDGDVQKVTKAKDRNTKDLIYIFVQVGQNYGQDKFFILREYELTNYICKNHSEYLKSKNGVRPKNPKSTHTSVELKFIKNYSDNWKIILESLQT